MGPDLLSNFVAKATELILLSVSCPKQTDPKLAFVIRFTD